jgi:hypothetical protein
LKIKIPSKNMYEKPTNTPIIHSVYWLCMVSPTCFGIMLPSSGTVLSAVWEMLSWGAVNRILWMGMLCLVTWCVAISDRHAPHHYTVFSRSTVFQGSCENGRRIRGNEKSGKPLFLTKKVVHCLLLLGRILPQLKIWLFEA